MRRQFSAALLASVLACAAGCTTSLRTIKVPSPVACAAQIPPRPAMPTEALAAGVDVDRFVAASQAEIELREGYEGELRAALTECTAPLHPS